MLCNCLAGLSEDALERRCVFIALFSRIQLCTNAFAVPIGPWHSGAQEHWACGSEGYQIHLFWDMIWELISG